MAVRYWNERDKQYLKYVDVVYLGSVLWITLDVEDKQQFQFNIEEAIQRTYMNVNTQIFGSVFSFWTETLRLEPKVALKP